MKLLDMRAMPHFELLKMTLGYKLSEQETDHELVAIIFAPPTQFVKSEVSDNFEYFHCRSNNIVDFFWAGYVPAEKKDPKGLWEINGTLWKFNPILFDQLRKEFEMETRWTFSGESDFLLFYALKDESGMIEFNFSNAIVINLEKAVKEKAISSVRELFEIVFRVSENLRKENISPNLSGKLITQLGKKSAFSLFVSLLPQRFHKNINTVYTFCTENIAKSSPEDI